MATGKNQKLVAVYKEWPFQSIHYLCVIFIDWGHTIFPLLGGYNMYLITKSII